MIRRCVITTAYALSTLGAALLALELLDRGFPEAEAVALCPNYDRVLVYSTHWDQTKRPAAPVRTIATPMPEECR